MEQSVKYLGSKREEAKQHYVVKCSERYEEIMQQYCGFVCTNIYPRTQQVLKFLIGLSQVSDGLIGMVRILRLSKAL